MIPRRWSSPARAITIRRCVGTISQDGRLEGRRGGNRRPGSPLHDLRHTGNTLAAQTGTSLRDLMTRMGHDSPRAALLYQHATSGADRAIADSLALALMGHVEPEADEEEQAAGTDDDDNGTAGVLPEVG
jgi:hypothetical protein